MAITKTTTLQRAEVYPAADSSALDSSNLKYPSVMAIYMDTLDDDSDDDLPVTATRVKHLEKFTITHGTDSNGDPTTSSADTVVSGEDALVQTLCTALWS